MVVEVTAGLIGCAGGARCGTGPGAGEVAWSAGVGGGRLELGGRQDQDLSGEDEVRDCPGWT